jgi:hypothetical protein
MSEHEETPTADASRAAALAAALQERLGMSEEDAHDIASVVLEQFGDQQEVNDETLEPTVRSVFYTLEAKKILSFRREEYTWENGEKRRGFWWRLRAEELEPKTTIVPVATEEDVYASLPKDAWSARQHA